jgi:hypothetical protein
MIGSPAGKEIVNSLGELKVNQLTPELLVSGLKTFSLEDIIMRR